MIDADGTGYVFGSGRNGPHVAMRLHDKALYWKLVINPELYVAETYMDGSMTFESGASVSDFLDLFSINRDRLYGSRWQRVLQRLFRHIRWLHPYNPILRSVFNAQQHYDLDERLYRLFLDEGMNYSCAYFRDPIAA